MKTINQETLSKIAESVKIKGVYDFESPFMYSLFMKKAVEAGTALILHLMSDDLSGIVFQPTLDNEMSIDEFERCTAYFYNLCTDEAYIARKHHPHAVGVFIEACNFCAKTMGLM